MGLFTKAPPKNLIRTLEGHSAPVWDCAISPDDEFIVSAGEDGTLRIWDVASGSLRATLEGHTGEVHGCEISSDGSFLVSAGEDQTVRIWDLPAGTHRMTLSGHITFRCAISRDGSFLLSAGPDGLTIWDVASGQERTTLGDHPAPVQRGAISPDGSFVVATCIDIEGHQKGADNSCVKVWDIASGWARNTLTFPLAGLCAVSSDGSFIVASSFLGMVRIWKADTGEEVRTWRAGDGNDLLVSLAISPDDSFIVTGENTVKLWETNTERQLAKFMAHQVKGKTAGTRGVAVSSDGSFIASAGADRTVKIWDVVAALAG